MRTGSDKRSAPRCPFCDAELQRPSDMVISEMEKVQGGTCTCGALFLLDPTGKNVGTVMVQALGVAAELLKKKMIEMAPGQDYEDAVLSYDWRTHRSSGDGGYPDGMGRLYVIRIKKEGGG